MIEEYPAPLMGVMVIAPPSDFIVELRCGGCSEAAAINLDRYLHDLLYFNRSLNLISRQGGESLARRLILESADAGRKLPLQASDTILDIGSGGGIPGIVVAVLRPEHRITLLERRRGRCDFLRRERSALDLDNLDVIEADASEAGRLDHGSGAWDWVLMKAVATPPEALALAVPFLSPRGRTVLFGNASWDPASKIDLARWRLDQRLELGGRSGKETAMLFVFSHCK